MRAGYTHDSRFFRSKLHLTRMSELEGEVTRGVRGLRRLERRSREHFATTAHSGPIATPSAVSGLPLVRSPVYQSAVSAAISRNPAPSARIRIRSTKLLKSDPVAPLHAYVIPPVGREIERGHTNPIPASPSIEGATLVVTLLRPPIYRAYLSSVRQRHGTAHLPRIVPSRSRSGFER